MLVSFRGRFLRPVLFQSVFRTSSKRSQSFHNPCSSDFSYALKYGVGSPNGFMRSTVGHTINNSMKILCKSSFEYSDSFIQLVI